MSDPVRPEPAAWLLYGEDPGLGEFILFDATTAEVLSDEIAAIMDCSTVGEARRPEPTLACTYLPGIDIEDDEGNPPPDDAPYDWRETGEAKEGEWPPLPGGSGFHELPLELLQDLTAYAGGHLVDTMSGSSFAVPLDREADLVTLVHAAGYKIRRDDGLISSLSAVSY